MLKEKITLKDMFKNGVHLGHFPPEWNPRMKSFIYGEKKKRHILDLVQTYNQINELLKFIEKSASQNKKFLFIGTKKHLAFLIKETAKACNSFYVDQRWLGGMLTNWKTIRSSLWQLKKLRKAEDLGQWNFLRKKETAKLVRSKYKLENSLSGLENMEKLPDVAIIVGQPEEINAIKECRRLGIATITLLDTNCDPSLVDWYILSNDDSVTSVQFILSKFKEAVLSGQEFKKKNQQLLSVQQNHMKLNKLKTQKKIQKKFKYKRKSIEIVSNFVKE
uniref:ribosomal protein S2 n=1 Tax=Prototheca miyajii TaxID=2034260 RepID=UPI003002CF5C